MNTLETLGHYSRELTHLSRIMALLQWDQEVGLPAGAAADRGHQVAALSRILHQKTVAPELGGLLNRAREEGPTTTEGALIRVLQRQYDQATKVPEDFVVDLAQHTSRAHGIWVTARRHHDFALFEPELKTLVRMNQQKAEYLGYGAEPYDALLDLYEEGLTAALTSRLFRDLQPALTTMLTAWRSDHRQAPPLLTKDLDLARQITFSETILQQMGYDFQRGRQDQTPHPFSTTIGHNDRRVTNRFQPRSIEFIFSALHEGGHALYEQGIAAELADTCLDEGVSLGIHESQSRLWENIIGRSQPFWQHTYPELRKTFPDHFAAVELAEFLQQINQIRPGPIRVEADEVSYNLHVLIRFEIERELLAGRLTTGELPERWNSLYEKYLGVRVESDADGVLQDIHWAHGSFGYFPTYTIGNLAAAQIWQAYTRYDKEYAETIAHGNLKKILNWLTTEIYQYGSIYPPADLILKVTGEPLTSRYFLAYLEEKYG